MTGPIPSTWRPGPSSLRQSPRSDSSPGTSDSESDYPNQPVLRLGVRHASGASATVARACPLGSVPPGQHPRARRPPRYNHDPERRAMNKNPFDVTVGVGDIPAAWPLGSSGKNKRICSFFLSATAMPLGRLWVRARPDGPQHCRAGAIVVVL